MDAENNTIGQFIPLHYHHNMLMDEQRMSSFETAIDRVVSPGAKVLDLGGGTGVLSWFASRKAAQVWCVELDPVLVEEARSLLAMNEHKARIEVVHADAFHFLPPESVDVVICEMIHTAMLREKLVAVLESFKRRYLERFGEPLPRFMPEAVLMAVQPIQQDYCFQGFNAPIIQFQRTDVIQTGTQELAPPAIYATLDFAQENDLFIDWAESFNISADGTVNALRFITKNILAMPARLSPSLNDSTVEWLNHYLVLPLSEPCDVHMGESLNVSFRYQMGGPISSLRNSLRTCVK